VFDGGSCKLTSHGRRPCRRIVGPVRLICSMAPNNVNTMACAAVSLVAFYTNFRWRIADRCTQPWIWQHSSKVNSGPKVGNMRCMPSILAFYIADWLIGMNLPPLCFLTHVQIRHIIEYEVLGENGFRTTVRRENPAQLGAVTGESTYFSFFSSLRGKILTSHVTLSL